MRRLDCGAFVHKDGEVLRTRTTRRELLASDRPPPGDVGDGVLERCVVPPAVVLDAAESPSDPVAAGIVTLEAIRMDGESGNGWDRTRRQDQLVELPNSVGMALEVSDDVREWKDG